VLTGHDLLDAGPAAIDYEAVVRTGGTLVILMGVHALPRLMQRLLDAGLPPATPAVAIEWGSLAHQRVIEASVAGLPAATKSKGLCAPATIVIGEVVRLRDEGLRWFDLPQLQGDREPEPEALRPILEE